MWWRVWTVVVAAVICSFLLPRSQAGAVVGVEKDWGEGLKVLTTYLPEQCEYQARNGDIIHYHYVGRLADGQEFGKSFDYDSPYIVTLGRGRIIAGMDRGLVDMCLWERRRITIPPHLAYGKRGVGSIIPPDATLVFYVRMIKIERSGQKLHKDLSLEELWEGALEAYGRNDWQSTTDLLEEALKLYTNYENQTFQCLLQCQEEASPQLLEPELETISSYARDDPVVRQLIVYAARAKCVRVCKSKHLSPKLRYPDPEILQKFRKRVPYSYLHFAYYQLDNYEEGARCLFTFASYNPDSDLLGPSIPFYRKVLELGPDESVWREPGVQPHQEAYLQGKSAYEQENYLEAVDHFESALPLYHQALDRCLLLCEDMLIMNITDKDMNPEKKDKLDTYSLSVDTLDYHSLLVTAVQEVLECRVGCHDDIARINGDAVQNYLPIHFHFLQFAYYKLGQILKTAETAATYLALVPSDEVMRNNIRIYTSTYKLQPEDFSPRQEYVAIGLKLDTEKRLLHFATHRQPKKKEGKRGDAQVKHQEL